MDTWHDERADSAAPGSDGTSAAFGLAGGCAAVVIVALATAALVAPGDLAGRVAAMAVAVGVLAAVLVDWRASLGVAVAAALIFVGFLAHRDGDLTGGTSAWAYTIAIGLALVLGRAQRLLRHATVRAASTPVATLPAGRRRAPVLNSVRELSR